jgi:hypothetical protein
MCTGFLSVFFHSRNLLCPYHLLGLGRGTRAGPGQPGPGLHHAHPSAGTTGWSHRGGWARAWQEGVVATCLESACELSRDSSWTRPSNSPLECPPAMQSLRQIGSEVASYVSAQGPPRSAGFRATIMKAWGPIDADGTRILLSDHQARGVGGQAADAAGNISALLGALARLRQRREACCSCRAGTALPAGHHARQAEGVSSAC